MKCSLQGPNFKSQAMAVQQLQNTSYVRKPLHTSFVTTKTICWSHLFLLLFLFFSILQSYITHHFLYPNILCKPTGLRKNKNKKNRSTYQNQPSSIVMSRAMSGQQEVWRSLQLWEQSDGNVFDILGEYGLKFAMPECNFCLSRVHMLDSFQMNHDLTQGNVWTMCIIWSKA